MVRNASISSVTTMVPISAEIADPERPLTTMAVNSGPSSRVKAITTISTTSCMAPNWLSSEALWMARMDPPQAATMATMGSASTPMADICFIALRQRPRLPTKGTRRGNAPSADQNWFVKLPTYASWLIMLLPMASRTLTC